MPSRARLDWQGDKLVKQMRAAAVAGVNETVDAARDDAKATHDPEWVNRPTRFSKTGGQLEHEIVSEHADPASREVGGPDPVGSFGFTKRRGFYGLFHEEGTVNERIRPVLRPAAARVFPTLIDRIRERIARGS